MQCIKKKRRKQILIFKAVIYHQHSLVWIKSYFAHCAFALSFFLIVRESMQYSTAQYRMKYSRPQQSAPRPLSTICACELRVERWMYGTHYSIYSVCIKQGVYYREYIVCAYLQVLQWIHVHTSSHSIAVIHVLCTSKLGNYYHK